MSVSVVFLVVASGGKDLGQGEITLHLMGSDFYADTHMDLFPSESRVVVI